MMQKKNIIGICGSASENSINLSILKWIKEFGKPDFDIEIIDNLTDLPHFRTVLTDNNTPQQIIDLRSKIANSDGVIFCTPEYIFSIPSGLKNMIEWCVSTTVFSEKPTGLITASVNGEKGHKELKLIMETIQAKFTNETTLLIQDIKAKIDENKIVVHEKTKTELLQFVESFKVLLDNIVSN